MNHARIVAGSDIRNSWSLWIMFMAFCACTLPHMIWNMDSTQFVCEAKGAGAELCFVKVEKDETPVTGTSTQGLPMAVKWVHMANARGNHIPLVLLIAIPTMGENDFFYKAIPGLSHSGEANAVGYVCFTKSRCGNAAFWNWFITNIAIDEIVKIRNIFGLTNDGTPLRAWFAMDGENIVLENLLTEDTLALLAQAMVDAGKYPHSTSLIYQALDRAATFKVGKKRLKHVTADATWVGDPVVELLLKHAFDELARGGIATDQHGKEARWPPIATTSEQRAKMIYAVLRIMYVLPSAVARINTVEGFRLAGQYPLDYWHIMLQCFRYHPRKTLEDMRATLEEKHVQFMRTNGRLTEQLLDEDDVPKLEAGMDNNSVPRDQRPLPNNRAVVLTSANTLATEQQRIIQRANAAVLHAAMLDARMLARQQKKQEKEKQKKLLKRKREAEKAAKKLAADRKKKLAAQVTAHVNLLPSRSRKEERRRLMELSDAERWNAVFPDDQVSVATAESPQDSSDSDSDEWRARAADRDQRPIHDHGSESSSSASNGSRMDDDGDEDGENTWGHDDDF